MGWWKDLKGAFEQGAGWDIHDVYDWIPGVESGEEKARMQKQDCLSLRHDLFVSD